VLVFVAPSTYGAIGIGFRAVAPDMRGNSQSDRPEAIDKFTLLHLVGDMVGVLDAQHARQRRVDPPG
jgi:pimeloyl-ACP methyl ester carboxylesterase